MINIKHLDYITSILREGSFTAASKKLFISQPALSQAVKQIENDIGAPLFDRSSDPLTLTYAGRRYLEAAQRILDIEKSLRTEIEASTQEVHARLRLGISSQRGIQILPLVVPEFSRLYPYIRLELVEHGSDTLERLLIEGECDIALVTTSRRSSRLRYVLIENEEVVLMASKETGLAQSIPDGTPIELTRALTERFVIMTEGHSIRNIQNQLFEQYHISPRILMESDNMEAAKITASLCDSVMLIPSVYVTPAMREHVNCYPLLQNPSERHFYFCCRRDMQLSRYMEDFARITCDRLSVPFSIPGDPEHSPVSKP